MAMAIVLWCYGYGARVMVLWSWCYGHGVMFMEGRCLLDLVRFNGLFLLDMILARSSVCAIILCFSMFSGAGCRDGECWGH